MTRVVGHSKLADSWSDSKMAEERLELLGNIMDDLVNIDFCSSEEIERSLLALLPKTQFDFLRLAVQARPSKIDGYAALIKKLGIPVISLGFFPFEMQCALSDIGAVTPSMFIAVCDNAKSQGPCLMESMLPELSVVNPRRFRQFLVELEIGDRELGEMQADNWSTHRKWRRGAFLTPVEAAIRHDDLATFKPFLTMETEKQVAANWMKMACECGSFEIFRFIHLNTGILDIRAAIRGGNIEIIRIHEEMGVSFEYCDWPAVEHHHNHIIEWMLETEKISRNLVWGIILGDALACGNIKGFFILVKYGMDPFGNCCSTVLLNQLIASDQTELATLVYQYGYRYDDSGIDYYAGPRFPCLSPLFTLPTTATLESLARVGFVSEYSMHIDELVRKQNKKRLTPKIMKIIAVIAQYR